MVIQDIARTARPMRPERPRESAGSGAKTTLEVAVVNASRTEFAFIDQLLSAPNAIRFSLTHVLGFEAARALLAARRFDSALVDATLSNHSGIELIRQLGGPQCPTPFILLAERDDPAIEAAAARVGATDCLDKRHLSPVLLKHVIWHARLQHGIENRLRESERLMRAAKEEAEEANRAKSEFLARVSFELRTPLNAVLGSSEIMREQMLGPVGAAAYAEYASDVHDSARHLLHLIDGMLDIMRIEAKGYELNTELIELPDLLAQAARAARAVHGCKSVPIDVRLDEGLPRLCADGRGMRRVLGDLLGRAVEACAAGGDVAIEAGRAEGGWLRIMVAAHTYAREGAEPALHPIGNGAGVAATFARSLIELHGGRVAISAEPDGGATVTLLLPPGRLFPAKP